MDFNLFRSIGDPGCNLKGAVAKSYIKEKTTFTLSDSFFTKNLKEAKKPNLEVDYEELRLVHYTLTEFAKARDAIQGYTNSLEIIHATKFILFIENHFTLNKLIFDLVRNCSFSLMLNGYTSTITQNSTQPKKRSSQQKFTGVGGILYTCSP